jgi:hypothetical protein
MYTLVYGKYMSLTPSDMQILKETLRMYGPLASITKCSPPGGITLNGYHIPGGTRLTVRVSISQHVNYVIASKHIIIIIMTVMFTILIYSCPHICRVVCPNTLKIRTPLNQADLIQGTKSKCESVTHDLPI